MNYEIVGFLLAMVATVMAVSEYQVIKKSAQTNMKTSEINKFRLYLKEFPARRNGKRHGTRIH